jgi:hypothetical protein
MALWHEEAGQEVLVGAIFIYQLFLTLTLDEKWTKLLVRV